MLTFIPRLRLGILAGAMLAYGCGSSSGGDITDPPAGGKTVAATGDLTFSPATTTIGVGQTVTFAFGPVPHNVFFDQQTGAPADIEGTNSGVSIDRTFTTAGSYPYTCHIHPSMHGTVVVQ